MSWTLFIDLFEFGLHMYQTVFYTGIVMNPIKLHSKIAEVLQTVTESMCTTNIENIVRYENLFTYFTCSDLTSFIFILGLESSARCS
jgi:hypothetical protein